MSKAAELAAQAGSIAMEHLSSTTVANSAQFVVFDNLSTDYDTFQFQF